MVGHQRKKSEKNSFRRSPSPLEYFSSLTSFPWSFPEHRVLGTRQEIGEMYAWFKPHLPLARWDIINTDCNPEKWPSQITVDHVLNRNSCLHRANPMLEMFAELQFTSQGNLHVTSRGPLICLRRCWQDLSLSYESCVRAQNLNLFRIKTLLEMGYNERDPIIEIFIAFIQNV